MSEYVSMNQGELKQALAQLREQYAAFQARNLKLDMSRGKPGADQTDLSVEMPVITVCSLPNRTPCTAAQI